MKIVFLSRLYSPHIGGVEKHVEKITQQLVLRGHQVIIITEQYDLSLPLYEKSGECLSIYRIPVITNNSSKKLAVWQWMIQHRLLFLSADIVHCHDVFFWYLPLRFLQPSMRVYTTFHGWEGVYPPKKRAKWIRMLSEKLSWGNMCVGEFIKKWYGTKPIVVTYGGVDLPNDLLFKQSSTTPHIVALGRIESDNGIACYAEILDSLKTRGFKHSFKAFGVGSMRHIYEKYGTVGFVTDSFKALKDADIVFASSYLAMLEALIMRKIVVAVYDNPLKKDYIQMSPFNAFVISGDNPDKLAEEIINIYKNRQKRDQIIEKGYNWAQKQTWDKVTDEYMELWKI